MHDGRDEVRLALLVTKYESDDTEKNRREDLKNEEDDRSVGDRFIEDQST